MNQKELRHLLSRAAFGMSAAHLDRFKGWSRTEVVNQLFKDAEAYSSFEIDMSEFIAEVNKMSSRNKKDLNELIKNSKSKFVELNTQWLDHVSNSKAELHERMLLFWTNHFVCKDKNVYHMQGYLNTLKTYALGDFRAFTKTVSKQASMLKYLNGKQNRKKSPNENFARELMELFTLGEGQYTEMDVRESARAFTGYNHKFSGEFIFKKAQHDMGEKRVLGTTGNFTGDDVIDLILNQDACATFISTKIYRYFVNPEINSNHIDAMAVVFRAGYSISELMRFVFTQDWFYEDKNIGVKIKSPIDMLASAYRIWPYKFVNDRTYIKLQKLLGQSLLAPPNVAGWPGNRHWIDTNTLMLRLKLPSLIYGISLTQGTQRATPMRKKRAPFSATSNPKWPEETYAEYNIEEMMRLMLSASSPGPERVVKDGSRKAHLAVQLMSLPEFQMS